MLAARAAVLLIALGLSAAAPARDPQPPPSQLDLAPDEAAGFGMSQLLAPLTGWFLGGPGYWYRARQLDVDTLPAGARLELFYVRANQQKRYEQGRSPVRILLPSRVRAGPRDSVTIRASLDGHRTREVHVRVRSRDERVTIELEPLSNSLVALAHTGLAGRTSLTFLLREPPVFRLRESDTGFSVVFESTAEEPGAGETLDGVSSAQLGSVRAQRVGDDLIVRVVLAETARAAGLELRSRQYFEPPRGLHGFAVDLAPPHGTLEVLRRAQDALGHARRRDVTGCALELERALREQLDPAALARALAPKGAFTDPIVRAALRRLGEVSPDGAVILRDGTRYRVEVPLELDAAAAQAADVEGVLALLRRMVGELEAADHRREALRGLIAPELGAAAFGDRLEAAEAREERCLESEPARDAARRPGYAGGRPVPGPAEPAWPHPEASGTSPAAAPIDLANASSPWAPRR